jgi:hypothetical protein
MKRKIYFLCSPNLGILDSWLPILYKLHSDGFKLVCIIPKPGGISSFKVDNALVKISMQIFDQIVYKTHSNFWVTSEFSSRALNANSLTRFKSFLVKSSIFSRKNKTLLFAFYIIQFVIYLIDKIKFKNLEKNLFLNSSQSNLLYDISEEGKSHNQEVFQVLHGVKKFSIFHGINLGCEKEYESKVERFQIKNTKVFAYTKEMKCHYLNTYPLQYDQVEVTGVPKYEKWWINKLIDESSVTHKSGYVFIISRPSNAYFSKEMKLKIAKDIKKFVIDKMRLRLIIKRHPKEIIGDSIFEDIFGVDNYGKSWEYSEQHAFSIGSKSLFAISFYSGVVVDMLAINKPTIEYIDLKNIVEFDNEFSLRVKGEPVFNFRYCGLTLGASNSEEFEIHLNEIANNPDKVVKYLSDSFNSLSLYNENSTNIIHSKIVNGFNT